ncbi:MAG TPA: RDD family protein [Vicinamibacterales bacterium]|nr:RDD family protein [Vicinamibacterales bacterium]
MGLLGFGGGAALGSTGTDAGIGAALGAFLMTIVTIVVVTIAYEVTLTALKGQTVGKMAMGIRIARADNGDLPGWGKAIMRWALPDDRRQGWHDKAAATIVLN